MGGGSWKGTWRQGGVGLGFRVIHCSACQSASGSMRPAHDDVGIAACRRIRACALPAGRRDETDRSRSERWSHEQRAVESDARLRGAVSCHVEDVCQESERDIGERERADGPRRGGWASTLSEAGAEDVLAITNLLGKRALEHLEHTWNGTREHSTRFNPFPTPGNRLFASASRDDRISFAQAP